MCFVEGVQFSADGKFLAMAERRDCKDFISLFECNTWQLVKVDYSPLFVCLLFYFTLYKHTLLHITDFLGKVLNVYYLSQKIWQ